MVMVHASKRIDFKNVLFLTDFSEPSCDALPFATAIARGYGSRVHAVHVLVPSTYAYMSPESAVSFLDDQEEWAKTEMARLDSQLSGLQREDIIERGNDLWEVVNRLMKEREIDLIVMGTHGRTGLKKALLGSYAEEVFRRSRVPVLMSGPEARVGAHNGGRFRSVLFATDFNDVSSVAAPYAVSLAQENQSQLILLHVLPQPRPGKAIKTADLSVAEAIHQLEDLVPQEARQWCRPRSLVEHGEPAARILAAAKENGADLIVLGIRGLDKLGRISTRVQKDIAYNVVARAQCPVLTVRG
ncbi:MAG: universal stress protein [Candidatus Acidiferrum sp.]